MPAAYGSSAGVSSLTALEKAMDGSGTRSSTVPTSSAKSIGTNAAAAFVRRSAPRYFGFPKNVTSSGPASSSAAAPLIVRSAGASGASVALVSWASSARVMKNRRGADRLIDLLEEHAKHDAAF